MTASGRLLFLLLVTGLFIRVWTEDTRQATERRLTRIRARDMHVVVHRVPDRLPQPQDNVTVNSRREPVRTDSLLQKPWRLANCPCPVPANLTAGTYRLVDNVGQVGLLDVTNEELAFLGLPADSAPFDVYAQTSGTTHWFFIRLRSATADATTAAVAPNETPVAISSLSEFECRRFNRKFDFTGYQ